MIELLTLACLALVALTIYVLGYITGRRHQADELRRLRRRLLRANEAAGARRTPRGVPVAWQPPTDPNPPRPLR